MKKRKKSLALFIAKKIEYEKSKDYENIIYEDLVEKCDLCYGFEEHENQIKESLKLLKYTFELYMFADYINKSIIGSKDSECNESFFDIEKALRFISSHFKKDFEEVIHYYKNKFGYV